MTAAELDRIRTSDLLDALERRCDVFAGAMLLRSDRSIPEARIRVRQFVAPSCQNGGLALIGLVNLMRRDTETTASAKVGLGEEGT